MSDCKVDFYVIGSQGGEPVATMCRTVFTIVTISLISSWCIQSSKVKKLLLFFSHWLSGLIHELADLIMNTMVSVCWSRSEAFFTIKTFKFLELASTNMLAVTNLAICVNLALIVSSHRTMTRVQSLSSPKIILGFLVVSIALTAISAAFWEDMAVSQTLYWARSHNQAQMDWIMISLFLVEFVVGVLMLLVVGMLLLFRLPEVRECWKLHRRIRYYFGLTGIAIVVNLAVGFGGMVVVLLGWKDWGVLISVSWGMRHMHIALDTLVLYGVLGGSSRDMDERGGARSEHSEMADVSRKQDNKPAGGKHMKWKVTHGETSSSASAGDCPTPTSSSIQAAPMCASV